MATKRRPFRPPGQAAAPQPAAAPEERPPVRAGDQTTPLPPEPSPDGAEGDIGAAARDITAGIELTQGIRVLRRIADGGMGTVFLAEQLGTAGFSKTVAVKVIKRDWLRDKRALGLFIGEAQLVADLVHDNICQVYSLAR